MNMAAVSDSVSIAVGPIDDRYGAAPVSRGRMRRALLIYAVVFICALVPVLTHAPAFWQAVGLGVILPGGGFLAVGGWASLLFPLTLVLMLAALALMLLMANAVAPLLVWIGAALGAGALCGGRIAPAAAYAVPLLAVAGLLWIIDKHRRIAHRELAQRERRNAFLRQAEQGVLARAVPAPPEDSRELTLDDLAHLRYAFDRALQPVDALDGFDVIEQFQTSSLRYQINNLLWPLQLAQCLYTPSFHGYLSTAQRNLIDKLTMPKVWKWWRWENLFGNLSLNADPIAKDNIMFGGFSSAHVALYTANTGDPHYLQPGSLSFRFNSRRIFRHSLLTMLEAGRRNHATAVYGPLYPCEPNLTYSACNLQGNFAHLIADRLLQIDYGRGLLGRLESMHLGEMLCRDGTVHAGRVVPLGVRIPVYTSNQVEALWGWMADAFFPELSRRLWARLREECVRFDEHGDIVITTESYDRMDLGNYQRSEIGPYTQFLVLAREHGDEEVAQAILRKLARDFGRMERAGCISYARVSNYNMGYILMGRILRCGDVRSMILRGPPQAALKGPLLTGVAYPEVLVARAISDGSNLQLVLYPGGSSMHTQLHIERLQPGSTYRVEVSGAPQPQVQADDAGSATVEIELRGRTLVHLTRLMG
jgi:MFS family permease